jgi:hypothetical protein
VDLEDGPRGFDVGPIEPYFNLRQPFQKGGVDEVLPVGRGNDGHVATIPESIQFCQERGEKPICV